MIQQPESEIEEMNIRRAFLYEQLDMAKEEYKRIYAGVM